MDHNNLVRAIETATEVTKRWRSSKSRAKSRHRLQQCGNLELSPLLTSIPRTVNDVRAYQHVQHTPVALSPGGAIVMECLEAHHAVEPVHSVKMQSMARLRTDLHRRDANAKEGDSQRTPQAASGARDGRVFRRRSHSKL